MSNNIKNKKLTPTRFKFGSKLDLIALILCLVAAVVIWLFVVNSNRTIIEKTVIVTVDARAQVLSDTGLSIINGNDALDYSQIKVSLKVEGTKTALDKYKDDEYIVKLVTDPIKNGGAGTYSLDFAKTVMPGNDVTLKAIEPAYVNSITVDTLSTGKRVNVTAMVNEGGLSDATLDSIYPIEPETQSKLDYLTISGPESIVESISKVVVRVNLANYSKSTVVKSKTFEFYDASGYSVKNDKNYISVDQSEVDVYLNIKYTDKAVAINAKYTVEDSDIYKYNVKINYTDSDKAEIRLTGDSLLFPESIECDLQGINEPASITQTVESLIEEKKIKIPEGLTVNADDLKKSVIIIITKDKIVEDVTKSDVT